MTKVGGGTSWRTHCIRMHEVWFYMSLGPYCFLYMSGGADRYRDMRGMKLAWGFWHLMEELLVVGGGVGSKQKAGGINWSCRTMGLRTGMDWRVHLFVLVAGKGLVDHKQVQIMVVSVEGWPGSTVSACLTCWLFSFPTADYRNARWLEIAVGMCSGRLFVPAYQSLFVVMEVYIESVAVLGWR